jgi:energy-coupling factor transporter transmembrane protein EcfT
MCLAYALIWAFSIIPWYRPYSQYPGWLPNVPQWIGWLLFLGILILYFFCAVKFDRSSVGGVFGKKRERDERQQTAAMRAYSMAYRILGVVVSAGAFYVFVVQLWFVHVPLPDARFGWALVISFLVLVWTLPKAIAFWTEPDPVEDEPERASPSSGLHRHET